LVKAEFVSSVRGRTGGLRLARPAQEISVGAVVRQTEDGFNLVDCGACVVSRGCGLRGLLGKATNAFLDVLDTCSLAELEHSPNLFDFMLPGPKEQDLGAAI
jgi:Rrf2 family transcriptional regulator, nitric oxide-sensitive transcriptional repressor